MKLIIITLKLFLFTVINGHDSSKLGIDFSPFLNQLETDFFNKNFSKQRGVFDFSNKKIGFAFEENIFLTSKNNFFERYHESNRKEFILILFSESEKKESLGYDAVVIKTNGKLDNIEKFRTSLIKSLSRREQSIPSCIYKCGLDTIAEINKHEAEYFNITTPPGYMDFSFTNERFAFFKCDNGIKQITKKDYFNSIKERLSHDYTGTNDERIILGYYEKKSILDYDFIIITWCHDLSFKEKNEIENKLKK